MESIDLLIACIRKLGGEDIVIAKANTVDFSLRGIPAFARVQDGGRIRGSVFVDAEVPTEDMAEACEWAEEQEVRACRVDALWYPEPETIGAIRLLFERELDPESIAPDDSLGAEAEALVASWFGDDLPARRSGGSFRASDPTHRAPSNAWLLMGGQDSYPTQEEIDLAREDAAVGIYEFSWTAAKQTEPGDLLFFYFPAPDKAIHFVARAVDHAYFDDIGPTGEKWSGRQWWTHITPMVEIQPIPLANLKQVTGNLVMRGRSGRYLRPEHAARLADEARALRPEDSSILARVLTPVVGRPDHPDPTTLSLAEWRELASGSFALEADVERLVVEPLLRMVLAGQPEATWAKAYAAGTRIVDYVVLDGTRPMCAIEVKLRVRRSATADWAQCQDFTQAADYGQRLGVPALLMDAVAIYLIPAGAEEPARTLTRSVLLDEDLETIRKHIYQRWPLVPEIAAR